MSRGQAAPRSAQVQDVWTRPLSPSSSMSHTPTYPTTHTLSHILSTSSHRDSGDVNVTDVSSVNSSAGLGILFTRTSSAGPDTLLTGTSSAESGTSLTGTSSTGSGTLLTRTSSFNQSRLGGSTEDYSRLKAEFYQSYNPQIGLHTAAVLGGILGWLIIYLLYKTKVKKWVLAFLRKKYKKRKQKRKEKKKREVFGEIRDNDLSSDPTAAHPCQCTSVNNPHPNVEPASGSQQQATKDHSPSQPLEDKLNGCSSACSKGQPPMPSIVVESCSSLPTSRPILTVQGPPVFPAAEADLAAHTSPKKNGTAEKGRAGRRQKKKKYRRRKGRGQGRPCPEVTILDVDDPDTTTLLLPPSSQADSAQATARWVQNIPLLMQSQHDVTGLLLNLRPTLLGSKKQQSCPLISAALQYAALPLLGLPHVGLNNSMPHLPDNGMGSLKSSRDLLFGNDDQDTEADKDLKLLQPLLYSAPVSRPQSSQSHLGTSSLPPQPPPRIPPIPSRTPPIPSRSPPRLTITIPDISQPLTSPRTLGVPGAAPWMTSCSAPTSPVPLPVTPTVTIQNCTPRVSAKKFGIRGPCGDSEDSVSSNSSVDPLLQLQNDCRCPTRSLPSPSRCPPPCPSLRPSLSPLQHHPSSPLARPVPSPSQSLPSPSALAKTSPRSSWTVFDDDGDGGSAACSRQNSIRFTFPPPPGRGCEDSRQGESGPQDSGFTLETKL